MIQFTVYGEPTTQGSKRAFVRGGRAVVVSHKPRRLSAWREAVAQAAGNTYQGEMLTGPVKLSMCFVRPRPNTHYGTGRNRGAVKPSAPAKPTTKPDVTKLVRSVEDACTGVIWRDDSQVVELIAEKRYGEQYRVEVRIEEVLPL